MQALCPFCKTSQDIPDHYAGRQVKCPSCNETFLAEKYIPQPLPPPPRPPRPPRLRPATAIGDVIGIFGILLTIIGALIFFANLNTYDTPNWAACYFLLGLGLLLISLWRLAIILNLILAQLKILEKILKNK